MLKPVSEWDEAFLLSLLGTPEGVDIDFKNEGALDKRNPERNAEICKDVSCFANAGGGVVLYGMSEKKGGGRDAVGIADALTGCDPGVINVDEIYQILNGGVEARLEGLVAKRIPLSSGRVSFAVEVQQAKAFAPHQVRDRGIYYCRHGSQILHMYDHQIRDVMRRSSDPNVYGRYEFFHTGADDYRFRFTIGNRSEVPATHLLAEMILEPTIVNNNSVFDFKRSHAGMSYQGRWLVKLGIEFGSVNLPLFNGYEKQIINGTMQLPPNRSYMFGFHLACSGSIVRSLQEVLRLQAPELIMKNKEWLV